MGERIRALTAPVEHGCAILRDSESKATHEFDPSRRISEIDNSVMFVVQPEVDGEVHFDIWRGEPEENLPEVLFDGEIALTYGRMVLSDPNEDFRISVPGLGHGGRVGILVDDLDYAERVQIVLRF
jgi:hypothetical protein